MAQTPTEQGIRDISTATSHVDILVVCDRGEHSSLSVVTFHSCSHSCLGSFLSKSFLLEKPNLGEANRNVGTSRCRIDSCYRTGLDEVKQEVYDPTEYESNDEEDIPDENLDIATLAMVDLLSNAEVDYAILGGFNLKLRGSPRKTNDIDIGVDLTPRALLDLLTQAPRRY